MTLLEAEQTLETKLKERRNGLSLSKNVQNMENVDLSTFDRYDTGTIYHKIDCQVTEVTTNTKTSSKYLSVDDVDIMHKSLRALSKELQEYANQPGSKTKEHREALSELIKRAKVAIEKIQEYYAAQERMERELFDKMREAIASKKFDEVDDLDTRFLTNVEEVKKLAKDMYVESLDLEKILNKIKVIEDVATAFVGIEAAIMAKADLIVAKKIPDEPIENLVKELNDVNEALVENRFKTSFQQKSGFFSIKQSRFIHDLYRVRERYALKVISDLKDKIDRSDFMMDQDNYLADTILFLDLHLQLILRSRCYLGLFTYGYLERHYAKLETYIDLVKLKYPNSDNLVFRLTILDDLINYYKIQNFEISNVAACKTLSTIQAIDNVV